MKFKVSIAGLSVATCIAGILCAQLICGLISCRNTFGLLFARGRLLALVHGSGIYEAEVQRATQEAQSRSVAKDSELTDAKIEKLSILSRLIANARVDDLARRTPISRATIDRDYGILQHQLRPEAAWLRVAACQWVLEANTPRRGRKRIAGATLDRTANRNSYSSHLRGVPWILSGAS